MTEDDAELVALIDGELDEASKARLLARLAVNDALRRRYEALRAVGAPIADGLAAILDAAPLARLAAALPSTASQPAPPSRRFSFAWRELAAGVAIGLLIAGAAAFLARSSSPPSDEDDWRAAVAEYAELYNADTFALYNPDTTQEAAQLRAVNQKLETALTPEQLALPGLKFKTAQLLNYEGKPLAEIAFVDDAGQPVLFCVTGGAKADRQRQAETRGELALSSWSRGGHAFLVIGRLPEPRVADLAATLSTRI